MREFQWSPNLPTPTSAEQVLAPPIRARFGIPAPRHLLLLPLALVYSNAFFFLVAISPYLLYGFYLALILLIGLGLAVDRAPLAALRPTLPYLFWIALYALAGTVISPYAGLVLPESARLLLRSVLILGAMAVALRDRRDFANFARLTQVAALVNAAAAIWEALNPLAAITFLAALDPLFSPSLTVFRPGGLFINPDEAAFAFLFSLLLSSRLGGPLAWAGRAAAVVGIYLGASRAGAYILALYGAVLLVQLLRRRWSFGAVTVLVNGCAAALLLVIILAQYAPNTLPNLDDLAASGGFRLSRILDFSEDSYSSQGYERDSVTRAAAEAALDAPLQGYGIFAMQGFGVTELNQLSTASLGALGIGAHNIYLVVLGELGPIGLASYAVLIAFGLGTAATARLAPPDRLLALLLWATYLLIGFVWHNLFTNVVGMMFTALVCLTPARLRLAQEGEGR